MVEACRKRRLLGSELASGDAQTGAITLTLGVHDSTQAAQMEMFGFTPAHNP